MRVEFADIEEVFTGLAHSVILTRRDSDRELDVLQVLVNLGSLVEESALDRNRDVSNFDL